MVNFFYFSVAVPVEAMTEDQLVQEIHAAYLAFSSCRERGQGISSKETVRKRNCETALLRLPGGIDVWNHEFADFPSY